MKRIRDTGLGVDGRKIVIRDAKRVEDLVGNNHDDSIRVSVMASRDSGPVLPPVLRCDNLYAFREKGHLIFPIDQPIQLCVEVDGKPRVVGKARVVWINRDGGFTYGRFKIEGDREVYL